MGRARFSTLLFLRPTDHYPDTHSSPSRHAAQLGWGRVWLGRWGLVGLGEGGEDSDGFAGLVECCGGSSPVGQGMPPFHTPDGVFDRHPTR